MPFHSPKRHNTIASMLAKLPDFPVCSNLSYCSEGRLARQSRWHSDAVSRGHRFTISIFSHRHIMSQKHRKIIPGIWLERTSRFQVR